GHPRRAGAHGPADVRRLLHTRPRLLLAEDEHDREPDQRVHAAGLGEGDRRRAHDRAGARAARPDGLLPPRHEASHQGGGRVTTGVVGWFRNPWGKPRWLALVAGLYIAWSIVPVGIAVLFAFNNGRSRTTWQGFSTRWFTGATGSVFHDPALQ